MSNRGFTLIELLVGIVIMGIIASVAAPNFSQFVAQRKVRATAEQIRDILLNARQEALKRNRSVTVDIKSNVITTTPSGSDTPLQQWQAGIPVDDITATIDGTGRATKAVTFSIKSDKYTCIGAGGPLHCYQIQLTPAGAARLCDPSKPAGNTEACLS